MASIGVKGRVVKLAKILGEGVKVHGCSRNHTGDRKIGGEDESVVCDERKPVFLEAPFVLITRKSLWDESADCLVNLDA